MEDPEEADAFVHALVRNWQTAPLNAADRALCEFAFKLTHRQHEMLPEDLNHLRIQDFNDRAVHDAVQIIGYFNYITRVADALGVESEDFIQQWGK